jgi:hypothetical protein
MLLLQSVTVVLAAVLLSQERLLLVGFDTNT